MRPMMNPAECVLLAIAIALLAVGPGALLVALLAGSVLPWALLLEIADAQVFAATGELLSGHTLKHLLAAAAALPVLSALARLRPVQNRAQSAAAVRA